MKLLRKLSKSINVCGQLVSPLGQWSFSVKGAKARGFFGSPKEAPGLVAVGVAVGIARTLVQTRGLGSNHGFGTDAGYFGEHGVHIVGFIGDTKASQ